MKLKHWQGYGCVNAKKISEKKDNGITKLTIRVTGNHEWGLECTDSYTSSNWLLKRFDKTFSDPRKVEHVHIISNPAPLNGTDTDECIYQFDYRKE